MTVEQEVETKVLELEHSIYYTSSSPFGMTRKLAERLDYDEYMVPFRYRKDPKRHTLLHAKKPFILISPTYKTERDQNYVPRSLKEFLATFDNYKRMVGVIAVGNINFGDDYCMSGVMISEKFNVPLLGRIELSGTREDAEDLNKYISQILTDKH